MKSQNEKSQAEKGRNKGKKQLLILIGNPNVGKSAIFGILTGSYAVVSNYPGTTVEIMRGTFNLSNKNFQVIDTPGVVNLLPMSADEVVTRDILLGEENYEILQVADSKNLARTLLISIQLIEMRVPFTLALNMHDEAMERGISIDYDKLSNVLGIKVIPTTAVSCTGIDKLKKALENPYVSSTRTYYDQVIEESLSKLCDILPDFPISKRSIALMILGGDHSIYRWIKDKISISNLEHVEEIIEETQKNYNEPLSFVINQQRFEAANSIVRQVASLPDTRRSGLAWKIGNLSIHRIWGIPILLFVFAALYLFVGKFAAGTVVDFMQSIVFGKYLIPAVASIIKKMTSSLFVNDLLVGKYGLISMGLSYAIAIVLPIITAFFIFFSLLEDSGYLPRLAVMMNRIFCKIGLNGKAILPMILGLGCGTMATISARILDTGRERFMVILLLSLGIPCSAQLGIVMGLLGSIKILGFLIWLFIVGGSLAITGYAANKVLPGKCSDFIMEIPPIRIPGIKNILIKTLSRIEWYLKEAFPVFMLASFFLFIIDKFGVLAFFENLARPVITKILGLPVETTASFIIGFLRRDYGAAGLMVMAKKGLLANNQLLVAMVVITLFLPCFAQLLVMVKERGIKQALLVTGFVISYAVAAGGILNFILRVTGVNL